jgi:polar amino acid transport system substrate-binding protein
MSYLAARAWRTGWRAFVCGWLAAPGLLAAQSVTMHYQERPPYSVATGDGRVAGLVAEPAARALEAAGIAYHWSRTPSQRQLALIQSGSGLHCGVGWFRTAGREMLGRFSRALHQDQPFEALARADAGLPPATTAAALLGDRRLRLLTKEGYSYGPQLDPLIERLRPRRVRTSVDPPQMGRMLRSGRADWMLVAPEEVAALGGGGLVAVPLGDMDAGPTRHLYCSRDLPDDWMARIDAALLAAPAVPAR